ncbi:MAG: hypothetical protein D6726_09405 [Nitrospirae bacterium]|nr:MAG: hypothetical protein D6726_09405 [Nitrospirota bacterium]
MQPLSQGVTPWKSNIKSSVKETLFDVPLSSLPEGDYQFFLVATTAGMLGASSIGEPDVNSNTNNTGSISKSSAEYYIIWPFMFQNRNTSGSIVMYARIPEGCTLLTDGPDWADLFFYIENGTLIANSFNFIDPDYNGIIHYDWKCWPDDEGYVRMHGEFYISNLKGHLTSNGKDLYYVFNIKEDSQVDYVSYTMGTFYTIPVEDTWTSEWTIPFEDGAILDYGTGVRFIFFLDLDQNR